MTEPGMQFFLNARRAQLLAAQNKPDNDNNLPGGRGVLGRVWEFVSGALREIPKSEIPFSSFFNVKAAGVRFKETHVIGRSLGFDVKSGAGERPCVRVFHVDLIPWALILLF